MLFRSLLREQLDTPFVTLPDEVKAKCDKDLIAFVEKATQRQPKDRISSCGEILKLLDEEVPGASHTLHGVSFTVLFDEKDDDQVHAILDDTKKRLESIRGARVLRGKLDNH